jgi:DNA-binding Lrp family transcriptional regulator
MTIRIDRIDAQIVSLLQEDGRMSVAEIARRLGDTTERIIRRRLDRLVDEHIIQVSAIASPPALGYPVTADVWVETSASATTELAAALMTMDQVSYISYSTGDRNISMQVHAESLAELHSLVNEVISKMPGVRRATVTIIPVVLKDIHQWQIPNKNIVG